LTPRGVSLRVIGGAPTGRGNIVFRALERACRLAGYRGGVEAELEKIIPAAAGLGGGSSDAAVAVLGLLRLTRTKAVPEEVHRLCRDLGSDVPFFLTGGCALGVGRGEEVYPLPDTPRRWCLLICPPIAISTPQAYRWARKVRRSRLTPLPRPANISCLSPLQGPLWATGNDFEPAVFSRFSSLRRLRSVLRNAGAECAALSGSGATVYALFARREQARRAAQRLAGEGAVFVAETVTRKDYGRALGLPWSSRASA
jgi:4-diphosphocytidyl-2-C-methyl-D-erythritol kinase